MSDRLPPLAWARAFREAGRQASFRAAAEALHVSPSTISHEIRRLEEWAGTPLFDRSKRTLCLTSAGETLHRHIDAAFAELEAGFATLRRPTTAPLRLGVFPFVASEFLLPRLAELEQLASGITIELAATTHVSDLRVAGTQPQDGQVDAVIRYDASTPAGLARIALTPISLQPVVAPGTGDRAPQQRIQIEGGFDAWSLLEAAGADLPSLPLSATRFDSYLSGLKAIEQGYGMGVAVLPLSGEWLLEGRIAASYTAPVRIEPQYGLVYRPDSAHRETLERIGAWLQSEFAAVQARLDAQLA